MFGVFFAMACDRPTQAAGDLPKPASDVPPATQASERHAVFAAGCFWCVEAVFQELDGVSEVVSGYAGGTAEDATYERVSSGRTDHAEVVRITYDPTRITYAQLLRVFFATHDPTQKDAQGPDRGRQYRSAIFHADEQERQVAADYIKQLTEAKAFAKPIVTTLEPLETFHQAEGYHQDFAQRNPNHPYITHWSIPKVSKVREKFPEKIRQPATQPADQGE